MEIIMKCIDTIMCGGPTDLKVLASTTVKGVRFIMTEECPVIMHRHGVVGKCRYGRVRWTREDEGCRELNEDERMMFKEMCERMDTWSADNRKFLKASRRL